MVLYTTAKVFAQNDIFIEAGFWSASIFKLMPLKHIYCSSSMSHCCRTPQKTRATATVQWNTAIDPMYSGSPKKCRNMGHIAVVVAPTAIVHISCSACIKNVNPFIYNLGMKDWMLKIWFYKARRKDVLSATELEGKEGTTTFFAMWNSFPWAAGK